MTWGLDHDRTCLDSAYPERFIWNTKQEGIWHVHCLRNVPTTELDFQLTDLLSSDEVSFVTMNVGQTITSNSRLSVVTSRLWPLRWHWDKNKTCSRLISPVTLDAPWKRTLRCVCQKCKATWLRRGKEDRVAKLLRRQVNSTGDLELDRLQARGQVRGQAGHLSANWFRDRLRG